MSRRDRLIRQRFRERFVITTDGGHTFEGLLIDCDDNSVVFRDAKSVQADGSRIAVDGELVVPRLAIAYMQLP